MVLRLLLLHPQAVVAKRFCGLLPQVGFVRVPPRAVRNLR